MQWLIFVSVEILVLSAQLQFAALLALLRELLHASLERLLPLLILSLYFPCKLLLGQGMDVLRRDVEVSHFEVLIRAHRWLGSILLLGKLID